MKTVRFSYYGKEPHGCIISTTDGKVCQSFITLFPSSVLFYGHTFFGQLLVRSNPMISRP